ncbi:hypothetical protein ES705_47036 [subsurface metagenome]
MALIKFGGGIIEMRGSIAGNVFSRNRYGAYSRARTKPINRNTPLQDAIRAIVSVVSRAWFETASQDQRDAWGVFAANVPAKNKLGEVIYLSGFNQYVKSNVTSISAGLPAIQAAPTTFTLPGEDTKFSITIASSVQALVVAFDDTRDWCSEDQAALIVQMGIPQNDSIEFFNGPWRYAGKSAGSSGNGPSTPEGLPVPYFVANDQKIWARGKILRADGRLSDWFQGIGIVVET